MKLSEAQREALNFAAVCEPIGLHVSSIFTRGHEDAVFGCERLKLLARGEPLPFAVFHITEAGRQALRDAE